MKVKSNGTQQAILQLIFFISFNFSNLYFRLLFLVLPSLALVPSSRAEGWFDLLSALNSYFLPTESADILPRPEPTYPHFIFQDPFEFEFKSVLIISLAMATRQSYPADWVCI